VLDLIPFAPAASRTTYSGPTWWLTLAGKLANVAMTLAFAGLSSFVSLAHAEIVMIGGGAGQIDVPQGYRAYFEDGRKTLVLLPPNTQKIAFRFTYHSMRAYAKQRPAIGKDFVQDVAKKRGLTTFSVEGNNGIAFFDLARTSMSGNERVQDTSGALGLDDAYMTFTLSASEDQLTSEAVREALISSLKALLSRVRSRGA
jgi:hypothetical protein